MKRQSGSKLVLRTETLRNLTPRQLGRVIGGATADADGCFFGDCTLGQACADLASYLSACSSPCDSVHDSCAAGDSDSPIPATDFPTV